MKFNSNGRPHDVQRRRFVQGLAAGGVLLGLSPIVRPVWAQEAGQTTTGTVPVLSGTEFDLEIAETAVNFTGKPRLATTVNGSLPAPTLRWREGDTVTIRVTNRLKKDTSIHWHGIILPNAMDGVPGVTYRGIAPGETFVYRFKVQQAGSYWYHSHSGFQEQTGLYGAIIIDPADGKDIQADRDFNVVLADWTDEDPWVVFRKLKIQGDYYNYHQPTLMDFFRDASNDGLSSAIGRRKMWNRMRMSPTDLADISGQTYTYLMNGTAPAGNWTGLFKPGERVRLRFVNGASQSFFDVRIPGLKMTVVQADGMNVEPVTVDEFRFGPGETYDVIVTPSDDAYTIFAQSMDRSGFARGTLAVREGVSAAVPKVDPVQQLTMADMMGSMAQGAMMGHGKTMHGDMGMDMGAKVQVHHASTEYGPSVDMRVDTPRTNLDDPGIGLRNNGRKVLTYADLYNLNPTPDPREPEREINLHLTGNMSRYMWSMNGIKFADADLLHLKYGERVRINLLNDTMMNHPIHLHGMWSDLETGDPNYIPRKHTVIVQPGARASYLVTADALGGWAYHCHLLYHMGGMFRHVVVS